MAEAKKGMRHEHSAGGAVVSYHDDKPWLAMIATRDRTRWGLPKGAISKGETSERAALREVLEETGIEAAIVETLETIEYFFRAGDMLIRKNVDFYIMRYVGGTLQPQLTEVDDVEWVPFDQMLDRASFDSEKKLIRRVAEFWASLPPERRGEFSR